jgi:hypothetical protein
MQSTTQALIRHAASNTTVVNSKHSFRIFLLHANHDSAPPPLFSPLLLVTRPFGNLRRHQGTHQVLHRLHRFHVLLHRNMVSASPGRLLYDEEVLPLLGSSPSSRFMTPNRDGRAIVGVNRQNMCMHSMSMHSNNA